MNTIKKFIHYYGPYKTVFFIDLICAAVISLIDLAYPQILRTMTKTLFTQDQSRILHALPVIAGGLFLMYVLQCLCKYYVTCQGHMMGANMERDMRQELFDHYQQLSFSYYSQNNSGQMMSKLVSDLFDISEFAHHGPENLFISLVKIIGAFVFLFFINKKLAFPLIILVIVMFWFSFKQNARMQTTFMENRRKIGDVNASLQDTLSGIRVVQSFANEDIEHNKFKKSNEAFLLSKRDNYRCMGSFMSSNLFFQGMMYLVTLVYGGYLIANGEMQTADLAMYALYIGIFISPIQILFTQDQSRILHALPVIAGGLFLMYVLQCLCKYYVTCQGHMMGANMERDMRQELFDHYQQLSFSYYSQNNSGQMMSKLVSDLFDISEFAHHGPENLFISLVKIIGAFVFLFFINKKLAFPLIILVIVMFWFSFKQNARMQTTFMENRRKIGDVNASLQDTLSGIRVVQSFANEDIEHNKFKKSNEAFLLSKRDNYRCMGSFMSSNLFFQGMMYLVTLVYGGYLIANGEMQTADLAMYALYIGIFISPIQILVELVEMMQKGLSGFRRFLDVMETESEITDAPDARELTDVKGHVSYEHVSFHYSDDNTPVLSDISIDIPAGKSVALVGPSGGGKTTICSLLPRFYDVTEGRITIDGKDIRSLTLKSLRNNIGTVQQDVYLFDGTIRDNIAYGKPGASDEEIIAAAKRASIHDFIMELPQQYDTYVGERGTRLSGGQKQRISIARVFLKNPPILILDEATSALDNESERWIQRSLEELSQNRTTITIAHRLSTIRDADEIIVITEDGIAERGTHEELLDMNGVYAAYYNM